MGRWVSGKKLHFHDYPKGGKESKINKFWECNCGEVFKLVKEEYDGSKEGPSTDRYWVDHYKYVEWKQI